MSTTGHIRRRELKPTHIADWHVRLLATGGRDGRPLGPRTVGHAHPVLHRALARAVETELLSRNVASVVKPPKVGETEIESLKADQIDTVLAALRGHVLEPVVLLALSSGARRGEILALAWENVDLDAATIKVERIIAKGMAGLVIVLALLMHDDAHAQQREFYDTRTGMSIGRAITGSNSSTTIYDASGRVTGRTSTGSNGTVTVYGSDGRRVGTVTTQTSK
jgi:YD repeat-containing protein